MILHQTTAAIDVVGSVKLLAHSDLTRRRKAGPVIAGTCVTKCLETL